MNKNIKIAGELIKIAKYIISNEEQFQEEYGDDTDNREYVENVKKDDGFGAIGVINGNEYVVCSGMDKNQVIKQAKKQGRNHYQEIDIYSKGKVIKTIKF